MHFKFNVWKTNFTMFFVFFVSLLQFADSTQNSLQNCDRKKIIAECTLNCPTSRCQKRLCFASGSNFPIVEIVVPICVLLLLVAAIFVTIKYVRSRQRNNRESLESKKLSVKNKYSFRRQRVPGPPNTMPSFPINGYVDDEHDYDYCELDDLRGKDNPMQVTARAEVSTDGGYETPNPPLGKPNFPPPHIPDSPTQTTSREITLVKHNS